VNFTWQLRSLLALGTNKLESKIVRRGGTERGNSTKFTWYHQQPINVPTAGTQPYLWITHIFKNDARSFVGRVTMWLSVKKVDTPVNGRRSPFGIDSV
jgi:hypothetical protein